MRLRSRKLGSFQNASRLASRRVGAGAARGAAGTHFGLRGCRTAAAAQTHPRGRWRGGDWARIALSVFRYRRPDHIGTSRDAGAQPDRKETRWGRRKLRPIDNRFVAVRNGNRRQCLKLPAIASRSCLGKRYSATLATKSTACFRSAVDRPQGMRRTRVGTPMVQSVIFGIVLYLTPSVLLLALLTCREEFDHWPEAVSGHPGLSRG